MLVIIKKCIFHIIKTEFYRFIIEFKKLNINLKKIKEYLVKKDLKILLSYNYFQNFTITVKGL